jgi:GntR family transcriptional regulator
VIDKDNPLPLYHQIKQELKKKIKNNKYDIGKPIPSETELMAKYKVSRMTIRLAIEELEREGYVKKVQGKGTFVRRKKVTQELNVITSWTETMKAQGKEPVTMAMVTKELDAPPDLAQEMKIEAGTKLYYIERLRYADGEPVCIGKVYVVAKYAPGLLEQPGIKDSIYKVLESKYNVELATASEVVEAYAADPDQAEMLNIDVGYPMLSVTRLSFDPLGNTIELSQVSTRADRYAYRVTLHGRYRNKD